MIINLNAYIPKRGCRTSPFQKRMLVIYLICSLIADNYYFAEPPAYVGDLDLRQRALVRLSFLKYTSQSRTQTSCNRRHKTTSLSYRAKVSAWCIVRMHCCTRSLGPRTATISATTYKMLPFSPFYRWCTVYDTGYAW